MPERRLTEGPKIGDPPTVIQSADVVELNRELARLQARVRRLEGALSQIEALTAGGKGQSAINMIAQLALNSDVPFDDLASYASQDVIIRETLLEVLSHAENDVVPVEAIRAMEAAIGDLPDEDAALAGTGEGRTDGERIVVASQEYRVPLNECPVGLFLWHDTLAVMTEYAATARGNIRQRDAYIVASGEYFWGGVSDPVERGKLLVRPCRVRIDAAMKEAERAQDR